MNDHETVSLASPRLEHFIEQARQYPPLQTAVVDAGEVHVLEGLLKAKAAIIQNAVDLARLLDIEQPKVAALSAVEVVKPAITSTIDAACLSKMADRGQIQHAIVDGPLAFDNAISAEAAGVKHITSPVAGDGTGSDHA